MVLAQGQSVIVEGQVARWFSVITICHMEVARLHTQHYTPTALTREMKSISSISLISKNCGNIVNR